MAIIRPTLGPITQSFGNLTTAKWKDKTVIKQKVPTNNTSSSPAQVKQRSSFALIGKLSGAFGPAIRVGFRALATSSTEQNVFVSKNAKLVTVDPSGVASIDYSMITLSAGNVEGAEIQLATYDNSTKEVTVTWANNSNGGSALPSDIAYAVVTNTKTFETFTSLPEFSRDTEGAVVPTTGIIPANKADYKVYLFFKRYNTTAASPTSVGNLS